MKRFNVRFWIVAMPIVAILVGALTIGYQYYHWGKLQRELDEASLEVQRLSPPSPSGRPGEVPPDPDAQHN